MFIWCPGEQAHRAVTPLKTARGHIYRSPSSNVRKLIVHAQAEGKSSNAPQQVQPQTNPWGVSVEDLALHEPDSRFYQWKENCRVHYVQAGSTGPPILFVHGFGVGSFHFDRNLKDLSRDHQVYACDLFGQGGSWPDAPPDRSDGLVYSIDTWTEQLAAFIEDVIAPPAGAYIAGNSLGGLLAVNVAYRHPQLVRGLMLLNATPFWTYFNARRGPEAVAGATVPLPPPASSFVRQTFFKFLSAPDTISKFLKQVYVEEQAITEELVGRMRAAAEHPHAADAFLSMFLAPRGEQGLGKMAAAIAAQGTPICLMHGKEDPWVKAWWARRLKRQVPSIEYYSISPAGHCPHHEVPQTVNRLIRMWIQAKEDNRNGPALALGDGLEVQEPSVTDSIPGDDAPAAETNGENGNRQAGGASRKVTVTVADGKALNWFEGLTF